jgi:hypothetical protein
MPAGELAARWRAGRVRRSQAVGRIVSESDPITALEGALSGRGPVVVAGSLYLVGVARGHLIDDPDLRDPDPAEDA